MNETQLMSEGAGLSSGVSGAEDVEGRGVARGDRRRRRGTARSGRGAPRLVAVLSAVVAALVVVAASSGSVASASVAALDGSVAAFGSAEPVTRAPAGSTCYSKVEVEYVAVMCERLAEGVQVRVVVDLEDYPDVTSGWSSQTGVWHEAWTNRMWRSHRVEFRADPSGAGSDCSAWIVTTKERTFGYDEHAVRARCWKVAPAVKVRGGADYTAQTDVHTEWFTQTGVEFQSKGQTRTVPAMPVAFLEYTLVDY
jgi:hypothetical protein